MNYDGKWIEERSGESFPSNLILSARFDTEIRKRAPPGIYSVFLEAGNHDLYADESKTIHVSVGWISRNFPASFAAYRLSKERWLDIIEAEKT